MEQNSNHLQADYSNDISQQNQISVAVIEDQDEDEQQNENSKKSVQSKENLIELYSFNDIQKNKQKETKQQEEEEQNQTIKKDENKKKEQQNIEQQQTQKIKKKVKKKRVQKQSGQPKRFEHLYNLNKVRQEALQALKEQTLTEEDKQLHECTFKPQLLGTSLMLAENQGQNFHERNQSWLEKKQAKLNFKDKKIKERRDYQCTFNPRIYRALTPRKQKNNDPLNETTKMFIERQKKAHQEHEQKKNYLNYVNKKKRKYNVAPQVSGYKKIYQKLNKVQDEKKQDRNALEKQIQKYTHSHVPVKIQLINNMNNQEDVNTEEHLDEIKMITNNLKNHIRELNGSLKQQQPMIKNLSNNVQTSQSKMDFVTNKLGVILQTKDNKQLYTIIILWLVLMAQIFLLIFTQLILAIIYIFNK